MNPPDHLPSGYEELTPDFLREYGAQEGMKRKMKRGKDWYPSNYKHGETVKEIHLEIFEYSAPLGTTAAATTPLPEGRCDCGQKHDFREAANTPPRIPICLNCGGGLTSGPCEHSPSCSSRLVYHHILPGALAAMERKPEGLLWACACAECCKNPTWTPYDMAWPFVIEHHVIEGTKSFAYCLPAPQVSNTAEEADEILKWLEENCYQATVAINGKYEREWHIEPHMISKTYHGKTLIDAARAAMKGEGK